MVLAPPPDGWTDVSLDALILRVQQHAGPEGYAVVKARTAFFKKDGLVRKAWIRCDRGGKPEKNSKTTGKRITSSRLDDCPFKAIIQRTRVGGVETDWVLTVINPDHSHGYTIPGSHPSLRKIALTTEIKETVVNLTRAGSRPSEVLSSLRLSTKDEEDPIFKARDIYNIKSKARAEALGSLTPVQALMQQLHVREDWFVRMRKHETTQRIEGLFFSRKSSQRILELNPEVLILDATYKTNKFKMPLLVITGVTCLNTSFYVAFAFMKSEYTADYMWVIQQLKALYNHLRIPYPNVLLTDCQDALINACIFVFPEASHLLCIWHIENNITTNCIKYFGADKDDWEAFRKDWQRVMYANTETDFDREWDALQVDYDDEYPLVVQYLADNIVTKKKKFGAPWTNKYLHFNNRATSRGECNNGKLKRQLGGSSIGDLKTVVDAIDLMLNNERQTYKIALDEAKNRCPTYCKKPIFRDLYTKVSPFALKQVLPHFLKVTNHEMKPCTQYFTTTMGLPCAHVIEQRMSEAAGVLKIEDIHPHWLLEKAIPRRDQTPIDDSEADSNSEADPDAVIDPAALELLHVNDPAVVKARGRPPGARNKSKKKRTREEAFEDSTQREPSQFEREIALRQQRRDSLAGLALTASQVANEEDIAAADAFFGPTTPAGRATSRGGSTPSVATSGGLQGMGGGRMRPLQLPPRRRRVPKGSIPAYAQGNEAMFGTFQL